jgi:Ca2+-binding RTX toxin-like protein
MTRFVPFIALAALFALFACKSDTAQNQSNTASQQDTNFVEKAAPATQNDWIGKGCDLVTDAEAKDLFGYEAERDFYSAKTFADRAYCLRKWKKSDWRDREDFNQKNLDKFKSPENNFIINAIYYGSPMAAKNRLDATRTERRKTYEADVPDLGEGAIWSTENTTLVIIAGSYVVYITVEVDEDKAANLAKAKEAAQIILKKMAL